MDEQQFYIEQHISGIWDNQDYSFTLKLKADGNNNTVSFTDKNKFPNQGSFGKFFIVKQDYYYLFRIIFTKDGSPVNAMDFKINSIDGANNKLELSHNGISVTLTKVVG